MVPQTKPDQFIAFFSPPTEGLWTIKIEAYSDVYTTWRSGLEKKLHAGFDSEVLYNELAIGQKIFLHAAKLYRNFAAQYKSIAADLANAELDIYHRTQHAISSEVHIQFTRYPVKDLISTSAGYPLWVERKRALYSSWYEFFFHALQVDGIIMVIRSMEHLLQRPRNLIV